MGRIAALVLALLAAQSTVDPTDTGRAVYEEGIGRDALEASMGEPPWSIPPHARACAACHGASGLGASEGGVAAPPLDWSGLSDAGVLDRLDRALRQGRGIDGRTLFAEMPRYKISDGDLTALASYVRRLPYPPQAGLTGFSLTIGLDLAGSGFSQSEQARLHDRFAAQLHRISDDGGLFGRRLLLGTAPNEALITISWAGLSDQPSLAIVARPPGTPECATCCASVHPDIEAQVAWLEQWLETRKAAVVYRGSLATKFARSPGPPRSTATVHIGPPGELRTLPVGPLYLFADLGRPVAPLSDRPETYLVSGIDLEARLARVDALVASDRYFADVPRLASAAIEIDDALRHVANALALSGRRVLRYEVCRRLRETVPAAYAFTVFDIAEGAIVAQASDRGTAD